MQKYTIFTDTHIGSKYCDDTLIIGDIVNSAADLNTILLGDIIDLACCPKKNLNFLRRDYALLKKEYGERYISGNHERDWNDQLQFSVIRDGVYFCHGDLLSNFEKWRAYRKKPQGAGFLKSIWVDFAEDFEWLKEKRNLPEAFITNAVQKAAGARCHTVVCGHFHPKEKIELVVNGIRIIVLPKGKSVIEV